VSTYRVGDYVRALIDQVTGKVRGFRTPADTDQLIVDAEELAAGSGAGLVGYDPALTFPADTVGERLRRTTYTVDAITSVNATTLGLVDGDVVVAKGRSAAGDGGADTFDITDTAPSTGLGGFYFSIGGGLYAVRQGYTVRTPNISWWGAKPEPGFDNAAAVNSAIQAIGTGGKLFASGGSFEFLSEILFDKASFTLEGCGLGYVRNLLPYYPDSLSFATRFLFKGTGATSIKTRHLYRSSAADPQDPPLSTALNIQNDGVNLRNLMVELYCDYTDLSPTNYGDDWDVGIFMGCRIATQLENVQVIGYWREASIWQDSTRGHTLPELNGYPVTEAYGSDGLTMRGVQTTGGKWGFRKQGPQPKPGLLHFGYIYKSAAQFVFASQPVDGDTVTISGTAYTFRTAATTLTEVTIGASTAATIDALIVRWQRQVGRLVPFDPLTLLRSGDNLLIYASTLAVALSETSANISVQTLTGSAATQTEPISDPARYYDQGLGTTVVDSRGGLGSSDTVLDACVICATEHHSFYRRDDIAVPPNKETDPAGGAMFIDGIAGPGVTHKFYAYGTRFQSVEPFSVRLGFCARVRFTDCVLDSAVSRWVSTTGAPLTSADSYGRYSGSDTKTAIVQISGHDDPEEYFPLGLNSNQVYSSFYLQGYDVSARRDVTAGRYARFGLTNTNAEIGYVEILAGKTANIELRWSNEQVANVGRFRVSTAGLATLATRASSGTGTLTDRMYWADGNTDTAQTFRPSVDLTIPLGSTSRRWTHVYSNVLAVVDGISTPGLVTGHAQIYVDSADGDLKVRFGDGTIKTIVTDT
jgi:hypothetical protein